MPPQPDPSSDALLLAAVARGDERAFEALYARYKDFVYRVALRHAARATDALDASQETFLYVCRGAGRIRLEGKLSTLLYAVARNHAIAAGRRRSETGLDAAAGTAEVAAPPGEASEVLARVWRLPEAQREVVILRVVEGLSVEETALALGIAPGTVKSRLHAAVETLRGQG